MISGPPGTGQGDAPGDKERPPCRRPYPRPWRPFLRVAVAEDSMRPTLRPGDWLIARRTRRIRSGQVVLAWHPSRDGLLLVKRVGRPADGGWWLVSDNPRAPGAADSSRFGPVSADAIVGRVVLRYFPFRTARLFPAARQPEKTRPAPG